MKERSADVVAFAARQIPDYLDSGGAKGHIVDLRFMGGYRYKTQLLIRHTGRKSGRSLITCLGYFQFGPEVAIVATSGGSDSHPQWYRNITAGGPLAFQIATQAFACTWREPEGEEYEEAWLWAGRSAPILLDHRRATDRRIPIVLLNPLDEIPVFTRADISPE